MRLDARFQICFVMGLLIPTLLVFSFGPLETFAQSADQQALYKKIEQLSHDLESQVIVWRRDFHQNPELSNREFRTAKLVADHLRNLKMDVQTEVAHTGVVGLLNAGKNGPVVALRADMDALPVTEETGLPFASTVRTTYNGQEVGVMHACGHDAHTSILMGAASVLARLKDDLPGEVKFIFQPSEEGAPNGEEGGAGLMIREGVLENPRPGAIFGLHVFPGPLGLIGYRSGPIMASSDGLRITVRGHQTHGAIPWAGVDPIVIASQIVLGLQTIVSRQVDLARTPAIVSIGIIQGGVRSNIIPEEVSLVGTIRCFDQQQREMIHRRVREIAEGIASSAGGSAVVSTSMGGTVLINDSDLTDEMIPSFVRAAGEENVQMIPPITASEDFALYAREIPTIFFSLGITPRDADPATVAMNHNPKFYVDEAALIVGVKAFAYLVVDYLFSHQSQ